jgi:hypothetical protein
MKKIIMIGLLIGGGSIQAMVPAVRALPGDTIDSTRVGERVGTVVPAVRAESQDPASVRRGVPAVGRRDAVRALPEKLYAQYGIDPERVRAVQKAVHALKDSNEFKMLPPHLSDQVLDELIAVALEREFSSRSFQRNLEFK